MLKTELKRKLLFRARHRGIREMDIILGRYCTAHLDAMSDSQVAVLAAVLRLNDQPMYQLLSEEFSEAAVSSLLAEAPQELREEMIVLLHDIHYWMRENPYRGAM